MREKHNLLRGTVLGFGVLLAAASFFTAVKLNVESPTPKTSEVTKSAGALWHENFEEAAALAKREKKPMLLYFTGSDWCGWCKKLHAEVLDRPEFTKWAAENVILVKLDFPRRKEQSEEIKKQNEELAGKYRVRGFPTVILLNSRGREIATTGYQPGGAAAYVTHLKSLLK